jgi:hypothetical protein
MNKLVRKIFLKIRVRTENNWVSGLDLVGLPAKSPRYQIAGLPDCRIAELPSFLVRYSFFF